MATPLKWRVGIDRLYESGINQVIYHGFPYHHPGFPNRAIIRSRRRTWR